jgi:hypothetical protein
MIHTAPFPTPADLAEFFNAPANATLRLVSVLPDLKAGTLTAIYETPPDPDAELEEERQRMLEERVLALIGMDDDKKRGANFPKAAILDGLSVPLSIVSNRLGQVAAFRALDNTARARWVRENAPAVGCAYISAEEARTHHGCAAELVRLLDE